MNQHLGVPFHSLVELLVRHFCLIDANFVTHHKAGLRLARDDQVSQVSVVHLDVALSRGQFETLAKASKSAGTNPHDENPQGESQNQPYLFKEFPKRYQNLPFP